MTRLLIVEPEATGHRMVLYVRLIAEEALSRGWHVTLMTTESARQHAAYRAVKSALGDQLNVVTMPERVQGTGSGKLKFLFGQRAYLRAFEQGYLEFKKAATADFIYVPYLNYIDKIAGLSGSPFGATPFGGMILSAKFHHHECGIAGPSGKQDVLSRMLFQRLLRLRTLSLATTIDEPLPQYVEQRMPALAQRVRYVPDASSIHRPSGRREGRQALGLDDDHFVVAAYGSLSPRKGLSRLMSLFSAADLPKHFRLVLAGLQDAGAARIVHQFMQTAGERCAQVIVLDRFCSEIEEGQVFAAADVMWICYENFSGMSGVLIQSAQAGLPVITANYGLIEHYRANRSLGLRWDDIAHAGAPAPRFDWEKLEALVRAMRGSASLAAFAAEHSPDQFGRNVINEIAEACIREGVHREFA